MQILIILSLVLFLFIAFVIWMTRYKKIMLYVCGFFIAVGFLIYAASFLSSGESVIDILLAVLRGTFSTAQMFFLNDDYSFLANAKGIEWLTDNKLMQIIFWLSHISAIVLIQTALISLFGRKLIDSFRLRFGLHNEIYIIKGSDKNAFLLAENIVTHDGREKNPDKKRLIVFLLDEDDDEKKIYEKASHFGGIVKVLERKHDFSYYLKKARLGNKYLIGKEKKFYIILMSKDASTLDDVQLIAEFAKENAVSPDKLDVFVFTKSEWDREEVEEITLMKDEIEDVGQKKEDSKPKRKYPYTFHIVNEVDLLTRQMIEKHPPFECLESNFSGGKADRNFTVMILGFGQVGQSALLRLVMNGQFVGSRMHATIIDKDIGNLQDCFLHRYPGLDISCDMEFKNVNVQRKEIFTLLDKEKNMDYIVAALHDDEMNKQTALDIRHHYERQGIKALPFIAVAELNGSLCKTKRLEKHEAKQDEKIFVFGSREEVYRESVIIREKTDLRAKAVRKVYGGQPWHELDWFFQESNRAAADFIPAMLKLAGIEENDILKKDTLTEDKTLTEILAHTEHLRWNAFHAAMGYRPIDIEEMNRRFKEYNGNEKQRLEFARRDTKARLQVCLVPWDELDKISGAYRELERCAGIEPKRDFKESDRKIIENIPKFLKAAEKKDHEKAH